MSRPGASDPGLEPAERELAERLVATRAVPAAGFRGSLGRRLAAEDPGYGPRPPGLRGSVALYLASGALMGGFGALRAVGVL